MRETCKHYHQTNETRRDKPVPTIEILTEVRPEHVTDARVHA
jgi:hypothetical protein